MSDENTAVDISVVVPVFNSAGTVPELCRRTRAALAALGVRAELIFIDDGSSDGSFAALCQEQRADPGIRIIKMLRNFGQHPAITAGLLHASGDWVVLMDDDLQTPPEEIARLYAKAKEGFDVVYGVRAQRQDGLGRRLGSRLAQWLMRRLFEGQGEDAVSSFRILSRRVVDTYLRLPETHTYVAALVSWLGFPQAAVPVAHEESRVRRSRYSWYKLVKVWLDMAIGFSDRPLKLASWVGLALSVLAAGLGVRVLVLYLASDHPVPGYASLFASQVFFFGMTLLFLGVLGEYVARIYREVKRRPYFIIDYQKSVGIRDADELRRGPPP
jgi:dolichol-phosphate mannosyltransferase